MDLQNIAIDFGVSSGVAALLFTVILPIAKAYLRRIRQRFDEIEKRIEREKDRQEKKRAELYDKMDQIIQIMFEIKADIKLLKFQTEINGEKKG